MFFAVSAYIYLIDEGLQFCIKAIQDFAYSGFGGRGGKHGDIFWDNESYAIKHYLNMFSELASATLKQVADWFVWLASTLAGSMPTNSDVPTMKSTTLPMAYIMGEFRSSSKGCQHRPLLYDSSPINWNLTFLLQI